MDYFKVLQRVITEIKSKVELDMNVSQLDKENYITIVEALDKQMPRLIEKKVVFEDLDSILSCPNCWQDVLVYEKEGFEDFKPNYCPECGQKLKWNNENKDMKTELYDKLPNEIYTIGEYNKSDKASQKYYYFSDVKCRHIKRKRNFE